MAKAKHDLVAMAQLQLESGKLYRKLKMYGMARRILREVSREMGMEESLGRNAEKTLNEMFRANQ